MEGTTPPATHRSPTSSSKGKKPEFREPETINTGTSKPFTKGKKNLHVPPLPAFQKGDIDPSAIFTPHPFDNLGVMAYPGMTQEDFDAFRQQGLQLPEYCLDLANTAFKDVIKKDGTLAGAKPPIQTVAAGVALLSVASCARFVLGKLLGDLIRTLHPDLGREAEVIVVALMNALMPPLEGRIIHDHGLPTAPDPTAWQTYHDAEVARISASLGGRVALSAKYERLRDDVVKSVEDRLKKDPDLRFRFANHKMIGVAVRACLSDLSLLGMAAAYAIHGATMTIAAREMHPQTGLDKLIFYAVDAAVFALSAGIVGGPLSAAGRILMNRHLQHGEPVRVSTPSPDLPKAYTTLREQVEKVEWLAQCIQDDTLKLSQKNADNLLARVDGALLMANQRRDSWDVAHATLQKPKVQAGAVAAADGWPYAMSVGAKWLGNYLVLIGARVAMNAVEQALMPPPGLSINSAFNATYNGTSDGMPGNSPNDILPLATTIGLPVIGGLMVGGRLLAPILQRALTPVAGAVLWAMGGGSPAPQAASVSSETAGNEGTSPTEDFPVLLRRFQVALQSIKDKLSDRPPPLGKKSSGNITIQQGSDDEIAMSELATSSQGNNDDEDLILAIDRALEVSEAFTQGQTSGATRPPKGTTVPSTSSSD